MTDRLLALILGQVCAHTQLVLLEKELELGVITIEHYLEVAAYVQRHATETLETATQILQEKDNTKTEDCAK